MGGFFHAVPETGELYARWFQLGAFSPIFRSHGWVWREHVPWAHGPEVEAICRRYAELRYRLLPYTYTLAWQAHTLGLPLMRPLVLNYPDDPRTLDARSRVPVGRRSAGGAGDPRGRHRVAGLSAARQWYDFWTGERHAGPAASRSRRRSIGCRCSCARARSCRSGPVVQHTGERPLDELTLQIYPEGTSRFELYEDDGRSNAYRRGRYALTPIVCEAAARAGHGPHRSRRPVIDRSCPRPPLSLSACALAARPP